MRKELLPGAGGDTSCSDSFFYSQVGFWDGCERGGQIDWTGATRTSSGGRVGEQMILGMNMALDPGRYYIRVGGYGTSPISYTLQTRASAISAAVKSVRFLLRTSSTSRARPIV